MPFSADELFLREALDLAHQGCGLASPNPMVGALLVDRCGHILGRGTHRYAERKHAEILAMEEAGEQARGNTLYLNLEPCSHTGRTGPCAEAIIRAGIARVVCSMEDPNPLVSGRGFQMLRDAGIEVSVGLLEDEALRLNESFVQYIRTGLPFVTLKAALSLDGRIAGPAAGSSQSYVTGEASRAQVHQMRHASDAILVGVGTVIADDPLLTDRSGLERRRPLQRVVLDSRLRIPLPSRLVATAQNDVIVFCSFAEEHKRRELEERGVRVVQVDVEAPQANGETSCEGRPDLYRILHVLGSEQITSLLVEGGASVNWAFLRSSLVDKLVLFYAPRLFGPVASVPWLAGSCPLPADAELKLSHVSMERYGEDFAVEAYLRDLHQPLRPQP